MNSFDCLDLCRQAGRILGLGDADALRTGAWLDGEYVGIFYDDEFDAGLQLCIDLGHVEAGCDRVQLYGELLDLNMQLSPERGEGFALDRESGHILFRCWIRNDELTPDSLAEELQACVSLIHQLREGPLSACTRTLA